ncbi:MAG: Hsp20/alpha crystallin family protein [Candidatus Kariarchaeaceae archaeon]|jgi:HSP20 family molecular chaperone IbpA
MRFNFSDDDMPDIEKIIELLRSQMFEQLRAQGIDPEELVNQLLNNPQMGTMGFSITMGPDGQPHIKSLQNKSPEIKKGFEEPFADIFFSEQSREYQMIVDLQGIQSLDMIHVGFDKRQFKLHAETGPFKYRLIRDLDHDVKPETARFALNNGILQVDVQIK